MNRLLDAAEAIRSLKQAIQKAPGLAEGYAVLGMILSETGPLEDAKMWSDAALSLDITVPFAIRTMARLHAFRGEWSLVDQLFEKVAATESVSVLRVGIVRFALWRRDAEIAEKCMKQAIEMDPAARLAMGIAKVVIERRPMSEVPELQKALTQQGGGWRRQTREFARATRTRTRRCGSRHRDGNPYCAVLRTPS